MVVAVSQWFAGAVRPQRQSARAGRRSRAGCGVVSGRGAEPRADRHGSGTDAAGSDPGARGVSRFQVSVIVQDSVVECGVVQCKATAMGSTAELMIVGRNGPALVEWAVDRLEQLEASWSRFRPESELRNLDGRAAAGVAASPDLVDAVGRALSLWYVTDGRFDPTVRSALEALGYDRTFRDVSPNGPALMEPSTPVPGCDGVRVDRESSTVSVPDGVTLDLGGIGKGLAADLLATGLVERGAEGACVGLGGDVRVAGTAAGGDPDWWIRIEDPLDESRTLAIRRLTDEAIVTCTTRFRRWTRGGRLLHHIIDPATGSSADRGVTAVVAQADEAWWAEGVAKAALVAGVPDGLELLERLGIAALIVDRDGEHHPTSRWVAT
jgi:thiamine biosynthesis lipoprotein